MDFTIPRIHNTTWTAVQHGDVGSERIGVSLLSLGIQERPGMLRGKSARVWNC